MNALVEVLLLTLERLGLVRAALCELTTCFTSPCAPALPLALVASLNGKVNVKNVGDPFERTKGPGGDGGFIIDLTSGHAGSALLLRQALVVGSFVAGLAREDVLQNPEIMTAFRQCVGPRVVVSFGGAQLVWLVTCAQSRVQTSDPATLVQFLAGEVVLWNSLPIEHVKAMACNRIATSFPPQQAVLSLRPGTPAGGQWQQMPQHSQFQGAQLQFNQQAPQQLIHGSPMVGTLPMSMSPMPQHYIVGPGTPFLPHGSPPNSPGTSSASNSEPHSPLIGMTPTTSTALAALATAAANPSGLLPGNILSAHQEDSPRGRRRRGAYRSTDSDEEEAAATTADEAVACPTGVYLKGVHAAQQGKALENAIKKHKSTFSKRQVLTDICKMKYRSAQRKLRIAKFIEQWPEIASMTQRAAERYISEQLKKTKKTGLISNAQSPEQAPAFPAAIMPIDIGENGSLLPPNTVPLNTISATITPSATSQLAALVGEGSAHPLSSLALAATGTV